MRQAVVIIHGIGEQRPMETLRALVAGALGVSAPTLRNRVFSKPDRISDTLELRRLNALPGPYGENYVLGKDSETDFYELYWQHLMQGTGWRPVLEWALYVLCHPRMLNTRLLAIWKRVAAIIVLVLAAIIVLGAVVWPALKISILWRWAVGLTIIFFVPLGVLGLRLLKWVVVGRVERFFLGFIGDAVRYLNPDPPNVEARRAIRTAGLTLLRGLHEDELRRYKRIILVGHSLGSVIAYDLITWFWQEQHYRVELDRVSGERKTVTTRPVETLPVPDNDQSPLEELGDPSKIGLEKFRERQRALWQSHRKNGLPWRITDLITLGSPLAHADVLLADGKETLDVGKDQREFPTCPPRPEDPRDGGLLWREYGEAERRHEVRILHHGAPFAVTRWTNLYFPGDVIGGPLAHLLGNGIKDVKLCPDPNSGSAAHSWRSHTHYWDHGEKKACRELLAALCLNEECTITKVP
jgi:hypothetical protein